MFTAAQIVAQGTITWLYLLNSIVIRKRFKYCLVELSAQKVLPKIFGGNEEYPSSPENL